MEKSPVVHDFAPLVAGAWAAYERLELAEALSDFETAALQSPDSYEAQLGLARTYIRMRQEEQAYAAARRCTELDSERPEGYAALGMLDFLTDQFDEAQKSLTKAVELGPQEIEPRLTLAQVYADLNRFDDSHAEIESAHELIDRIADEALRRQMVAYSLHARAYIALAEGKTSEARDLAQEIVSYEADNPYAACLAYANLGLMEARNRHFDDAIAHLDRAFTMNPFFHRAGSALGRILLVRGEGERAAEVLERVIDAIPRVDGHTLHAYAAALAKAGRREEALIQYRAAVHTGLRGLEGLVARWNLVWLHHVGRIVVIAGGLALLLVWIVYGRPSAQTLTFGLILVVILALQRYFGRRK